MRRLSLFLTAALFALFLAGCGSSNVPNASPDGSPIVTPGSAETATNSNDATPSPATSDPSSISDADLKKSAQSVIELLRERDLESLSQWIDEENGLRFSPYSHLNKDSDLVFQADQLPEFKDTSPLKWGVADGSGEDISLSFRDYYEKYVYNQDFADAPNVSVNSIMATGNVAFNGSEVYPDASYVEFYFPGFDKENQGVDWQSLVLLFVPRNEEWKLVAIVHGQWTI